jgi:hypothetical protein
MIIKSLFGKKWRKLFVTQFITIKLAPVLLGLSCKTAISVVLPIEAINLEVEIMGANLK